jgi:CIC family chloride channel protein
VLDRPAPSLTSRLRRLLRLRRLYFLRAELRWVPTQSQRLFALTVTIGVVCGLAAVAFHVSLRVASHFAIDSALSAPGYTWIFLTLLVPTVGAVLSGILLLFVPNARGSGIPQVKAAFGLSGTRLRLRDAAGKFVIATLQIGSGSSLGREGPTVHICAGIANALGRMMGVSGQNLRRLLPVGAAAGIAAAFNAPIAAVTFTIEEVVGDLDKSVLSGVIVAAALSAVIERSILGEHPVFDVQQGLGLHHASSLLLYAALGVAAAIVSIVFTDALLALRLRMRAVRALPVWLQPGIGGLVTGALATVALGWLHTRGVTGGGYETLTVALSGGLALRVMLVLCAMKVVATVCSYSTGGAGGIFAPSLFIGGMLGGVFGTIDVAVFGHAPNDTLGAFALVGMGAVFSGIVRAPITSVLIIIEMTGGYSLILPLMIANMSAYVIARQRRPVPIYEALLVQDGVHLHDRGLMDVLEGVRLDRIVHQEPFRSFVPTTRADELTGKPSGARDQDVYPVLDAGGAMVGVITSEELGILAAEPSLWPLVNASDLMRAPFAVRADDDLRKAFEVMLAHGVRELPVVDDGGKVVGFVDEAGIAKAYMRGQTASSPFLSKSAMP